MKKALPTFAFILCFLIGLSLLLYPAVSNRWNARHASQAIVDYDAAKEALTAEDYTQFFEAAQDYNERILQTEFPFMYHDKVEGYDESLNPDGSGMMGYITIEKINVQLPIYHGTSEGVLQKAVGHLEGSSLPTGGEGNHCVLSAHRGLPSAKLFSDLDQLREGDIFVLTVLDRQLHYAVDRILIVEPQEVEALYPQGGEDYCTLITCTPYGVNSHRMLVRGRRISVQKQEEQVLAEDATMLPPYTAAVLILPLLMTALIPTGKRKRRA